MSTNSSFITVAKHELRTLGRDKTFLLLLGIFFSMTFFSVFIGWATRITTSAIYVATVAVLHSAGNVSVLPDPISTISSLAVFDNMIIYILLVGALLSIVIGHRSFMRERKSGVIPLVFVRPVSKGIYIAGKLFGIAVALAVIMFCTLAVSSISAFFIPALHLSMAEFVRLSGFYAISFLYLYFFSVIGMIFSVLLSSESVALFAPILFWIALVFILPELSTGQNPVALLNPITLSQTTPSQGPFFGLMRVVLGPFSISQYYTGIALMFLKAGTYTSLSLWNGIASVGNAIIGLATYLILACVATIYAVRSYIFSSDPLL